jgi:hypothetical protein
LTQQVNKVKVISYDMIQEQYDIVCGLEFRKLDLPAPLKAMQQDPQACFQFIMADEVNVICATAHIRPVMKNRMLMKKVHELCMKAQLNAGNISDKQFDQLAIESDATGGTMMGGGV